MNSATIGMDGMTGIYQSSAVPSGLIELRDRVRSMPFEVRSVLEPIVDDACEDAMFRGRVLNVARDALERLRLDLAMTRFDLDATRRERETLRKLLDREVDSFDN